MYKIICNGKEEFAETRRKAISRAKTICAENRGGNVGIYFGDELIKKITIHNIC